MTKEKSNLVTTSLIGSVEWFLSAPDVVIKDSKGGDGHTTWKEKALQDLKNNLGRIPGEFSEEARQGVELEKMVYKYANDIEKVHERVSKNFIALCKEVEGFQFYQKKGINKEVQGMNCYLYCKFDAIKLPEIKDLKTTKRYDPEKYLKGFQHKFYCYVTGADRFEYVVAEWDEYPKIKAVHKEIYIVKDRGQLEREVIGRIEETFSLLKELKLWDLYRDKYCLY